MRKLLPLVLLGACTTPRTEVVIGVATDMPTTMLDEIKISIYREGVITFDIPPWTVQGPTGGDYELPATFGVYSDDGTEPKIQVVLEGSKIGAKVIERRATFSLAKEKTLYLRMALLQSCKGLFQSCSESQSCIEGSCRSAEVDVHTLNDYFDGEEKFIYCQTAATLIDTKTGAPLANAPAGGPMIGCNNCVEGACYKAP